MLDLSLLTAGSSASDQDRDHGGELFRCCSTPCRSAKSSHSPKTTDLKSRSFAPCKSSTLLPRKPAVLKKASANPDFVSNSVHQKNEANRKNSKARPSSKKNKLTNSLTPVSLLPPWFDDVTSDAGGQIESLNLSYSTIYCY